MGKNNDRWLFPTTAWWWDLQICGCLHEVWGQVCWACCQSSPAVLKNRGRSFWPGEPAGRPPRRPGPASGWFRKPGSGEGVERGVKTWLQRGYSHPRGRSFSTDHIKSSEDVAVMVTGLEIFGDVGKCRQILWILSCTRDVTDLVFRYDVLQRQKRLLKCLQNKYDLLFILNAPKTTITAVLFFPLSNSCWVNYLHFYVGQSEICSLLLFNTEISEAGNHVQKSPMGHRYSKASSLYVFPF